RALSITPQWAIDLFDIPETAQSNFEINDRLSFLGNFIPDACDFWSTGQAGAILRAGLWEESLKCGTKIELEAKAVKLGERKILIVRKVTGEITADREIFQKARENLLSFENLFRTEKDLEKYRDFLETEVAKRTEQLQLAFEKTRKTLNDAINTMAKIVEMRDPYTSGHQHRVAELATAVATEMGCGDDQIEQLRMAATIHDIGKIYVPSDILSKPGKITDSEYKLIKTHAQGGYDIVKGMDFPSAVAESILQHHERLDGSGYPNNVKDQEICLEARILSVCDVVEAMGSHRPYRPTLGIDMALDEISKNKGRLYDPVVVDACVNLFTEKGFKFGE
ncbi:MAG: HD-GYP domain-containing protein, partial [Dehalococcoidia bacterium]